jgi:hypothetical protein
MGCDLAYRTARIVFALVTFVTVAGSTLACQTGNMSGSKDENQMTRNTIEEVYKRRSDQLMAISGVVGIAIGEREGKPCIMVLVDKRTPELINKIPSELEGYPVVVQETGPIRALDVR